ncbi:MAG: CoA transferase subunit A [Deltaproteobacteria bacterium]|nr:CoA transferase subunit A [Deltaproteobacteria bacterium]
MSKVSKKVKVMSAQEAVDKFVFDGAVIGIGGQNVARCAVALAHEIIKQGKKDLTVTGCNLSIHMDLLVGAGLVKKCEFGLGGLGRFGSTFQFKRAIETRRMEAEDYDHLTMGCRFLAGEMGIPFIPVIGLMGSDIIKHQVASTKKKFEIITNPWNQQEKVLLVSAMQPDVSIIHVQKADEIGNLLIQGIASHEPELIRASTATIVSCEEIVSTNFFRSNSDSTTVPYHYVDAVVEQRFGAYPTSAYGYYNFDADHINYYQECARAGGDEYEKYMHEYIYGCETFDLFLEKCGGREKLECLEQEMLQIM